MFPHLNGLLSTTYTCFVPAKQTVLIIHYFTLVLTSVFTKVEPRYTKSQSTEKIVRYSGVFVYSKDPTVTNYLVNSKDIRYSGVI